MDALLNVNPGLIIWTIINFCVFLFIIIKFGTKPIVNGLKKREDRINSAIENAEKANTETQRILIESQAKLDNAQKEMMEIVNKGKVQGDELIRKATEEAEKVKVAKIEEAKREIERSKESALKELRNEVASLVVRATEKLLDEKLDQDKHLKLVDSYIDKLPKN